MTDYEKLCTAMRDAIEEKVNVRVQQGEPMGIAEPFRVVSGPDVDTLGAFMTLSEVTVEINPENAIIQ
jgi:hypothetical protein